MPCTPVTDYRDTPINEAKEEMIAGGTAEKPENLIQGGHYVYCI